MLNLASHVQILFCYKLQAAPKKEKKKKMKRTKEDDEDQEQENDLESQEDEIPASITLNSTFECGLDEEQVVRESPLPPDEVARPMSPDLVIQAASIPLPISPGSPLEIPRQGTPVLGVSTSETCGNIRRSFPLKFALPKTTGEDDDDDALYVPSFQPVESLILPTLSGEEEYKEEEAIARIPLPPTFAPNLSQGEASVISSNFEYYDDDETDDNVCAICLDGYEEGEVLISSKYCSHLFHKDCILEWLDKHDVCPCCRVDMVTDSEVNKAARELVGKTRLCKAIAMKRMQATPPASPPGRARAHSGVRSPQGVSPLVHRANVPRTPRGLSPLVHRAIGPRTPRGVSPLAHRANGSRTPRSASPLVRRTNGHTR